MIASLFLFIGLAVVAIAAIRRRSGVRVFIWLGIWSAMYGAVHLSQLSPVTAMLPRWLQVSVPLVNTTMTFLLVVAGSLAFAELSLGVVRTLIRVTAWAGFAVAVGAVAVFVLTGSNSRLLLFNNALATCALILLTVVVVVPKLSAKYLVFSERGVLAVGTLIFALEALFVNITRPMGFASPLILDHIGFAIFLFSFGYVALQRVLESERRLLSIENELAIAREIQASILPGGVPELAGLRVAAAYHPMTAVAGDFYEFIAVDQNRAGFLVADVSGHGVPAALIASMIKVAVQAIVPFAHDPRAVLGGLNRALSGQLRGQLVSAAYLWIDSAARQARYAAAGHPPLLRWQQEKLERIESNGLPFGVPLESDYPVCTMPIGPGDRFLLYTDGVTEPENAGGDSFGDTRLEEVLRNNQRRSPSECSDQLLFELRRWQPVSAPQPDDITLIVIDVA